mmetsp:Transcript_21963/g.64899  ORF Transcript_21963/g.64899 Transcript_21963/m.64899 type:complete len:333 (+) Transcript_21963:2788-3786(+)
MIQHQILHPLLQSPHPALEHRRGRRLMERPVSLQYVVGGLPHEHLGRSQLHVRLGKRHGRRLMLQPANLLRHGDALLGGIGTPSLPRGLPLLQQNVHQFDAQRLWRSGFDRPRQLLVGDRGEDDAIPLEESRVIETDGVAHTGNADGLQYAAVPQLLREALPGDELWLGRVIRLEAADVMRLGLLDLGHELVQLFLELHTDRLGLGGLSSPSRLGHRSRLGDGLLLYPVQILHQLTGGRLEERLGREGYLVLVLLEEASLRGVLDQSGEVPDAEDAAGFLDGGSLKPSILADGLTLVGDVSLVETIGPIAVRPSATETALVVQHGQYARRSG